MSASSDALYMPLLVAASPNGGPLHPRQRPRIGVGLQGLIFGAVTAALDLAGTRGYQAITHESPAPEADPQPRR